MEYKFTIKQNEDGVEISVKDVQNTSASISELDMSTLLSINYKYSENNLPVLDNLDNFLKAIGVYICFYSSEVIKISNNKRQQTFKQYSMKVRDLYKDVYGSYPNKDELYMFVKLLGGLETLTLRIGKDKEPTRIKMISIQACDNENIIFAAPYFEYCYYKILQEMQKNM